MLLDLWFHHHVIVQQGAAAYIPLRFFKPLTIRIKEEDEALMLSVFDGM